MKMGRNVGRRSGLVGVFVWLGRLNRLPAVTVATRKKPGYYADGGNLYLRLAPGGSKGSRSLDSLSAAGHGRQDQHRRYYRAMKSQLHSASNLERNQLDRNAKGTFAELLNRTETGSKDVLQSPVPLMAREERINLQRREVHRSATARETDSRPGIVPASATAAKINALFVVRISVGFALATQLATAGSC